MRRYDIQITIPSLGKYEVIKENTNPTGCQEEDYWEECFTWQDLKVLVPALRRIGWKPKVFAVDDDDLPGRIHLFPFTYGIRNDVKMFTIANMRLVLTRDPGCTWPFTTSSKPFGY